MEQISEADLGAEKKMWSTAPVFFVRARAFAPYTLGETLVGQKATL